MKNLIEKFGPWALVTGASSGMGVEFARRLAESGLNVVLVARREDRLHRLAMELESKYSVQTKVVALDLSREDFLKPLGEATADIQIGLLVNNAGFATSGDFLDNDLDDELRMLSLNSRAPLMLTYHFGRHMRERGKGGIIFVSSTVAFSGAPSWSNYAATKAFDLTLADGITRELWRDGVSVLTVAPGPTRSEFWNVTGGKPLLALSPEKVVRAALSSIGRRSLMVPGLVNKLIVLSTRLAPRRLNAVIFGAVVKSMHKAKPKRKEAKSARHDLAHATDN